eukprot:CAMPEP_0181068320 /NCGR_PEP_ID=MMETSP1070-20121207/26354_1 /TAXON_ID=265543 /ORGANISM="Minutocellus polymorphus, Strain NH13" /LENGTH=75 /DNA_ID=CAMNT_0023149059 /DNA_START=263 /DNA_END=490 /DNA_ORIENTATION=-
MARSMRLSLLRPVSLAKRFSSSFVITKAPSGNNDKPEASPALSSLRDTASFNGIADEMSGSTSALLLFTTPLEES